MPMTESNLVPHLVRWPNIWQSNSTANC